MYVAYTQLSADAGVSVGALYDECEQDTGGERAEATYAVTL